MSVRKLEDAPSLTRLYAKAAVTGVTGGDGLPDTEFVLSRVDVDRDHLAAYDRVCGYRLRDRLPVTYPHILAFPLQIQLMATREFPFALPGLVHVANSITQHRPIGADEPLQLRVEARDLRAHPKGRQFDLVSRVSVDDELVWDAISTYLKQGGGSGDGEAPGPDVDPDHLPAGATWDVPSDTGRRYAAVAGDRNPIHLHPLTSRLFGFPKPIAHGMWTHARAMAALEGRLPDRYEVAVAFQKPLLLGRTVQFRRHRSDDGTWRFAVTAPDGGSPYVAGRLAPVG